MGLGEFFRSYPRLLTICQAQFNKLKVPLKKNTIFSNVPGGNVKELHQAVKTMPGKILQVQSFSKKIPII